MCDSNIKLPATTSGAPDWEYMQAFIESLPFSSQIRDVSPVPV
jgi:hypothetical protein